MLHHVEGDMRGRPFLLARWQKAVIGNLFGWKRTDDAGRTVRRFRKAFIYIPRGNGKTPLAAGIALYCMWCDGEAGAQISLAAGDKTQAGYLFRNANAMVKLEPVLRDGIRIFGGESGAGGLRSMQLKSDTMTVCNVVSADAEGKHGGIPHLTVIDEVHVQKSPDLINVFETGMSKKTRAQPLLVGITTADYDQPSICNTLHAQACAVRDNGGDRAKKGYDPYFLPVVYELTADEDWKDEKNWVKANPNWGVSVDAEGMRTEFKQAIENPVYENEFKRLHLNMKTGQDVKVIDLADWDKCAASESNPFPDVAGRKGWGGLDLSSSEDTTAYPLIFPLDDGRIAIRTRIYCPEEKVAHRARMGVPYNQWQKSGHIIATAGDQIDYDVVEEQIEEDSQAYDLKLVSFDPHGATQLANNLTAGGIETLRVNQNVGQLSVAVKELLRLVKAGLVVHDGNPVARWQAGNVSAYFKGKLPDGQRACDCLDKLPMMFSKQKSKDKIDFWAALATGIAGWMGTKPEEDQSGGVGCLVL